jgi:hypothetical protein
MSERICSVDGCPEPARARGWCHAHYERWRRNGTPGDAVIAAPTGARNPIAPGTRFGLLEVVGYQGHDGKNALYLCQCDCGNTASVRSGDLRNGSYRSCSCRRGPWRHGMTRTPTWFSWIAMRQRCLNPKSVKWPDYGGRGIRVCDRWLDSFETFLADVGVRPEGKTLDRVDVDGNYEPRNVRWATPAEQARNRRPRVGAAA